MTQVYGIIFIKIDNTKFINSLEG